MSDDANPFWFIVTIFVGLIAGVVIASICFGKNENKVKGEAVERGYGHWTPDPKTGEAVWSWNEPEKK